MLEKFHIFDYRYLYIRMPIRVRYGSEYRDCLICDYRNNSIKVVFVKEDGEITTSPIAVNEVTEGLIEIEPLAYSDVVTKSNLRMNEFKEYPVRTFYKFKQDFLKVGDLVKIYLINFTERQGVVKNIEKTCIEVACFRFGKEQIISVKAEYVLFGKMQIEKLTE
ncbi:hypothetical protein IQ283_22565 [Alkalihalobacillus hwajinpoensis]|uniref:hypothetical protein n=1 Tax=Guptibacillus hwajinpoensis TaxID=208199 RepID=UPI0018846D5C|nr:hypothetical protein [Pseudalkalibacillus hwajinpoensis]MBF0709384.1 hypothetical protein [Pseudalkalibacillus hwajinpoensis]